MYSPGQQPPPPGYVPPQPQQQPPSNAFEKFMLTITGMSALAILFILLVPLLMCIGLGFFCIIGSHSFASMAQATMTATH